MILANANEECQKCKADEEIESSCKHGKYNGANPTQKWIFIPRDAIMKNYHNEIDSNEPKNTAHRIRKSRWLK